MAVTLADMLQDNTTIRKVTINSIGNPSEFIYSFDILGSYVAMSKFLSTNKTVNYVDFSYNSIEEKGITALSNEFFSIAELSSINIASCSIGESGENSL